MASAGPCASQHLTPERQPHQHPTTLFFYRPDALPAAQPTASKHWRQYQSTENSKKKLITKTMYVDKNEQGQRSMEKHTDNWCLTQCRGILHIIIKTHVFLNKYVFDFCITGDQTSRHNYNLVILNKLSWFKAQSTTKKPQYQHSIHGPNCLTTEFNQSVTQFLRTKLLTTFN